MPKDITPGKPRRGGTARRRRTRRCGWFARCGRSWAPISARSRGWHAARLRAGVGAGLGASGRDRRGSAPGVSTDEAARVKELEQENRELRRANEILRRAASFFGAELDRQQRRSWSSSTTTGTRSSKDASSGSSPSAGSCVQQGCRWPRASTTRSRPVRPRNAPARCGHGAGPAPAVGGQLPGLRRPQAVEGRPAGRSRHRPRPGRPADAGRRHRRGAAHQAGPDHQARSGRVRHPDLVERDFTATAPNQLWVTDLTYVPTWAGVAYVCFITDAFSRTIVGWRVASHMRTTMVLDAIEMARWSRGTRLAGLRCHSDAGSQFTSIRYGERLAEIGAVPSIGTVADSYDNALAETLNGYYKAELIRGPAREGRPWKTRRGCRTGHPGLGALAQQPAAPRLPQRRPASRVRGDVLRSTTDRPDPGRNPIARASTEPRAVQPRSRTWDLPFRTAGMARPGRPGGSGARRDGFAGVEVGGLEAAHQGVEVHQDDDGGVEAAGLGEALGRVALDQLGEGLPEPLGGGPALTRLRGVLWMLGVGGRRSRRGLS